MESAFLLVEQYVAKVAQGNEHLNVSSYRSPTKFFRGIGNNKAVGFAPRPKNSERRNIWKPFRAARQPMAGPAPGNR